MASPAVATLVVPVALSRIDALAVIALAVDGHVEGVGTADSFVPLADGARAYVEIPRFGDPPPFAIDVESDAGPEAARAAALALEVALRAATPWAVRRDF